MSLLLMIAMMQATPVDLPVVRITKDDTEITKSCRVLIPASTVIHDENDNGVIHIKADGVTVVFDEKEGTLRGAPPDTPWDQCKGVGIRVDGCKNVTVKNARVHFFRVGIWATDADGLTLDGCDVSDGYAMRLKSTPAAEDGSDWLWPHKNDDHEWMKNYGAGVYVERTKGATIRNTLARRRQNGILIDRVTESRIYDNDCSFLSGWGLAMWRSSRNVISRNAFDFCVRGYSHEVYNRGQDSAGILCFEQNNGNTIAENSATHGGDGFFGFAGREAIGEEPPPTPDFDYRRRGNSDNLLIANDFSYAPAHGIEMTFSFGNRFINNRLVGNAICGIWGGFSQDSLIAGNTFEDNGGMGYGLERGGVNIEHGKNNRVVHNLFRNNKCGVHYWFNPGTNFKERAWAKVNGIESINNLIAGNTFEGGKLLFHFRGPTETTLGRNTIRSAEKELEAEKDSIVKRSEDDGGAFETPRYEVFGEKRPVGARKELYGRENIIMTEWFPWDHSSPMARLAESKGSEHVYHLHKLPADAKVTVRGARVSGREGPSGPGGRWKTFVVAADGAGVHPYTLEVRSSTFSMTAAGTILTAKWDATFFRWSGPEGERVPPADLEAWRAGAGKPDAVRAKLDHLALKYGFGGPSDAVADAAVREAKFKGDYFGMIATTRLPLTKGTWRVSTLSDDGVRVIVDGKTVLENWTHHGPERNDGEFTLDADREVDIKVEHFEIFGYAVLEFEIGPAK